MQAIQLGAIACKQAPPNRVNLLSKANRLSRRSALTGREPRATSDPRGNGCPRAPNAGGAAWAARITGAARSPQTPTPTPSGCLDYVRLTRPDPVRGIKRDGAVMFLRSPALPATGNHLGDDFVLENQFLGGGGHGVSGVSGRIAA